MWNGRVSCSRSPRGLRAFRVLGRLGCCAGAEITIQPLEGPAGSQAGQRGQFRTYRSRRAYRRPNDLGGGRCDLRTVRRPRPHCAHQSLACPYRPKARPIAHTITELNPRTPRNTRNTPPGLAGASSPICTETGLPSRSRSSRVSGCFGCRRAPDVEG